jgi:hypothetical protein
VAERKRAAGEDPAFTRDKIAVARFYAEHALTRVPGLRDSVVARGGGGECGGAGSVCVMALADED